MLVFLLFFIVSNLFLNFFIFNLNFLIWVFVIVLDGNLICDMIIVREILIRGILCFIFIMLLLVEKSVMGV